MGLFKNDNRTTESKQPGEDQSSVLSLFSEEERRIAQKLLDDGRVDEQELEEAHTQSTRHGDSIGRVLMDMGIVSVSELMEIMMSEADDSPDNNGASSHGSEQSSQPASHRSSEGHSQQRAEAGQTTRRLVSTTFRVGAENATQVSQSVGLTITPPTRTSLDVEKTISPESIPEDETTEVNITLVIRNTRRATGRNVAIDLQDLPAWFSISESRVDGQLVSGTGGKALPVLVGDIPGGQSKTAVIRGIASPSPEEKEEPAIPVGV